MKIIVFFTFLILMLMISETYISMNDNLYLQAHKGNPLLYGSEYEYDIETLMSIIRLNLFVYLFIYYLFSLICLFVRIL